MTKFEKVIKGLECCILRDPDDHARCSKCSYGHNCVNRLKIDALELLKEREAVKPKEVNMYPTGQYACGFCGHISVGSKDYHAKYCPECGRAVTWE